MNPLVFPPMRFFLALPFLAVSLHAAPEAFEVSANKVDQLPGGKEADGIIGDFMLRNDKVEAVISANLTLRRANMSTFYGEDGITPGALYDLTLRGANNDQITYFGPAAQQGKVSWVRVATDPAHPEEAVVEVVATGALGDGVMKKHQYRLRDGWQGVLVTTTVTNERAEPKTVPLADKWTNFKRQGATSGIAWAEAVDPADRAGYAYGLTESPADFVPTKAKTLKPGETITFSRFLAVGQSPLEAVGVVAEKRGEVGRVSGAITDAVGKPVTTAQVMASDDKGVAGVAQTDAQGRVAFALPPGKYTAEINDLGRPTATLPLQVDAGSDVKIDTKLALASAVQFDIRDEAKRSIPCKAQFLAEDGTELVNLGPEMRAHGCRDQYFSERGEFRVQLPPGKYRVVVTHGIEFSHLEQIVELKPGTTFSFAGTLKRLVDTTGWVSADYHNHSTPSGDNVCGTDDRLINLAAEQVEFAPTTEHNRLYDWRPHIDRLGLGDFLQTVPGMELTGSLAHFNSFPFKPEPRRQDNGAPTWNKDPRITAITLRDWQGAEPDRWVQINHPDMSKDFIDADSDGRPDGGFIGLASLIDGVETQNYSDSNILHPAPWKIGRNKEGKENASEVREFVWLQMLNRGHRYAGMAVCDAHTVWGNGVGGWRMYMPSASDEPAKIDWRENSRHAKAGRSILSSGPFLTVETSDGTLPGGTTRAQSGGVKLRVKVQCTDWIDIDRVQVLVNGRQPADLNFTREKNPEMFGQGVVKFEREIFVPLSQDAHVIVVARGENSTLATGYGTSAQAPIHPTAYNNPIFVDADGGGFTPNGDSIGWPLPTAKPKIDDIKRQLAAQGLETAPPAVKPVAP